MSLALTEDQNEMLTRLLDNAGTANVLDGLADRMAQKSRDHGATPAGIRYGRLAAAIRAARGEWR